LLALVALLVLAACPAADDVEAGGAWEAQSGPRFQVQTTLRPFTWRGTVEWVGDGLRAQPGGTWELDYELDVDLKSWERRFGEFTELIVAVQGWRAHDRNGTWQPGMSSLAVTSRLSTAGGPVEHFSGWTTMRLLHGRDGSPLEAVAHHRIEGTVAARHVLKGRLRAELPSDTPEGWYEPRVLVAVQVAGQKEPVFLDNYGDNANTQDCQILPLVEVGSPKPPHLPLALAAPDHYRGQRATLPKEDLGRYELVGRSGYPRDLILPPGRYNMGPMFPHLFPEAMIAPVDGGFDVVPERVRS
jgi:hypothetical protein